MFHLSHRWCVGFLEALFTGFGGHLLSVCTQEWWTHLWLNEGFASWIEYLCVDYCFPEYDIWTQFVSADYTRALDLDALDSSHPIEVSCKQIHVLKFKATCSFNLFIYTRLHVNTHIML